MKKFFAILSAPLSHVFTLLVNAGYIRIQLKVAQVVPVFKLGDKQSLDNYRPI
jgi:hypothetical protein